MPPELSRTLVTHGPEAILVGANRRIFKNRRVRTGRRTDGGALPGPSPVRPLLGPSTPVHKRRRLLPVLSPSYPSSSRSSPTLGIARRINSPESSLKRSRSNSSVHYWERLMRALHCRTRSDESLPLREGRAPTEGESEGATHHTLTNVLPSHSGLVRIVPRPRRPSKVSFE